jgi:hypothetical protein
VGGLPDPLATSNTISFDYRYSKFGTHYIGEVRTDTGSSTNDNHMVIDGSVIMLAGMPVSELGAIPAEVGGLPGENWDNFDYTGITEDLQYMFTGDTGGDTATDEFVLKNGSILYREGDILDGETLSGSIEGAYMNENGDIVFIWDIQDNTLEALYANDRLLLKEGDAVDIDGDLVPDPQAVLTNFTGISSVTMAERGGDGTTKIYFTADVDITAAPAVKSAPPLQNPLVTAENLDTEGLSLEDLENLQEPGSPGREVLEGAFCLIVPTVVPAYLAAFDVVPQTGRVTIEWRVSGSESAVFRLVGRQDGSSWEIPYHQMPDGRFVAQDERATHGGPITYSLYRQSEDGGWSLLDNQTLQLQVPDLATRLLGAQPNPFNPQTKIAFSVGQAQRVRLTVYDMTGRLVALLADEVFPAGSHAVDWDGRDLTGQEAASGTYVAQLEAGGKLDAQKLMLVR